MTDEADEPTAPDPGRAVEPSVEDDLRTAEEVAAELDAVEAELRSLDDPHPHDPNPDDPHAPSP